MKNYEMIHFEKVAFEDIPQLVALMTDFYAIDNYPIDTQLTTINFKHFIENEHLGYIYKIVQSEEIIGYFIIAQLFSFEFGGMIAFLDELYINEKGRGLGIGKKAVQFIQSMTDQWNLKVLYLEVELHNERAIELYKKQGFKPHHRDLMIWKSK